MRQLVAALLLSAASAGGLPALSGEGSCSPSTSGDTTYIVCRDQSGTVISITPVTAPGPGTGGPRPDPSTLVSVPYLTAGMPDGSLCIAVRIVSTPGGPNSSVATQAEQTWLRLAPDYPFCPGGPPPSPSVTAYAENFIRTIPLPAPNPRIAPGYAITGKPGYLETGANLNPPAVTQPTPFGPLQVVMVAQYFVHWGDETDPTTFAGPFAVEGAPWPSGALTHTWTSVGTYTIVVQMGWTATWQLGPDVGTLTGITTSASLTDFPVEQLQAVID